MKRWPIKLLNDVCERITDGSHRTPVFTESGFPFATVAHVDENGKIDFDACSRISPTDYEELKRNDCRPLPGDVLFSKDGTVGKVAVIDYDRDFTVLSSLAILRPKREVLHQRFLAYALKSEPMLSQAMHRKSGTAIRRIVLRDLRNVSLPVPPLAEQERVVKLLDEADELRKLRAQADRRAADLIPALFHEMFGDPLANPKCWPQSLFAEVGKLDRGRSKNRPRDEPCLYGGEHPFIQTGDVANANGQITTHTQTYSEKGLAQSRMWPTGTLVITIAANIGKTAILTFPACFPDSMVGFVPSKKVLVDYVRQWLVTMESHLEEAAPQMAQKNINLRILSKLVIPVPPLPLQQEFAQRVSEIRGLEAAQAASRQRTEHLFQSMLHRAFNQAL